MRPTQPGYNPITRGLVFNGSTTILTSPLSFAALPSKALSMMAICTLAKQSPYRGLAIFRDSANTGAVSINIGSEGDRYNLTLWRDVQRARPLPRQWVMDVVSRASAPSRANSLSRCDQQHGLRRRGNLVGRHRFKCHADDRERPYDTTASSSVTIYEVFISSVPCRSTTSPLQRLRTLEVRDPQRLAAGDLFRNSAAMIGD